MDIHDLTYKVIGAAYKVHNTLGPGFLERVYENALKLELENLGINVRQQIKLPVWYEGHRVGVYYPDLWIEGQLIVEIKAAVTLAPEHESQLINYLVATGIENGLLINFASSVQVKRKFRDYKSSLSDRSNDIRRSSVETLLAKQSDGAQGSPCSETAAPERS